MERHIPYTRAYDLQGFALEHPSIKFDDHLGLGEADKYNLAFPSGLKLELWISDNYKEAWLYTNLEGEKAMSNYLEVMTDLDKEFIEYLENEAEYNNEWEEIKELLLEGFT